MSMPKYEIKKLLTPNQTEVLNSMTKLADEKLSSVTEKRMITMRAYLHFLKQPKEPVLMSQDNL